MIFRYLLIINICLDSYWLILAKECLSWKLQVFIGLLIYYYDIIFKYIVYGSYLLDQIQCFWWKYSNISYN